MAWHNCTNGSKVHEKLGSFAQNIAPKNQQLAIDSFG